MSYLVEAEDLLPPSPEELEFSLERARLTYVAGTIGPLFRRLGVTDGLIEFETPLTENLPPEDIQRDYIRVVAYFLNRTLGDELVGERAQFNARAYLGSERSDRHRQIREVFAQYSLSRPLIPRRPLAHGDDSTPKTVDFTTVKLRPQLHYERVKLSEIISSQVQL